MYWIKRWGLLSFLLVLMGLFFYFRIYDYLSFDTLKLYRMDLIAWRQAHLISALFLFALFYVLATAISVPGAWFLTLLAGFLFGPVLGSILVIFSATLGAFVVYLAVKFALRDWIAKKNTYWLKRMEQGFQENAFSYLLFLRFVPLFPFWLVNLVPALLGVPARIFVMATFLGIIPGTVVYVLVGNSMGHVLDMNQTPNLSVLFKDPMVLFPLLALGLLALVPIIYRYIKNINTNRSNQ
jgi:uncharacterized membrane protein YdjX (TVP38/TMEM64 family)